MSVEVATVTSCWLKSLHEWPSGCAFAISHLNCPLHKQSVNLLLLVQVHNHSAVLLAYRRRSKPSHLIHFNPIHPPEKSIPKLVCPTSRYAYQSLKDTIVLHRASLCRSRSLPKGSSRRTLSTSTSRKRSRYRQFPTELTPKQVIPLS